MLNAVVPSNGKAKSEMAKRIKFALGSVVLLTGGCFRPPAECDPRFGDCPPPAPGVYVDNLELRRSTWFESNATGGTFGSSSNLCTAEARSRSGTEVVFRGPEGLIVIEHSEGRSLSSSLLRYGLYDEVELHDFDGDGNTEFTIDRFDFENPETAFYSSDGFLMFAIPKNFIDWEVIDIGNDAGPEFVIYDDEGAETSIWAEDGEPIGVFANLRGEQVLIANLDTDVEPEIVLRGISVIDGEGELTVWELGGIFVTEITAIGAAAGNTFIAALNDNPTQHLIGFNCALHDLNGTVISDDPSVWLPVENGVTRPDDGENRSCLDFIPVRRPTEIELDCPFRGGSTELILDDRSASYAVQVQNSVLYTPPTIPLIGSGSYDPVRTIIRVFNDSGELVYHEVIATGSGPGSFAVIEGTVPGRQGLLIADENRILVYEIGD